MTQYEERKTKFDNISFEIAKDTNLKLRKQAADMGISRSELIRRAISHFLINQ